MFNMETVNNLRIVKKLKTGQTNLQTRNYVVQLCATNTQLNIIEAFIFNNIWLL